jgi:ubiquinone/menaquinone biosynthesis C-methylase UbiE
MATNMKDFDKTRQLYNNFASEFANKFEKIPENQQLDEFIALLEPGDKVLDLGCGSGRDAEYLSRAGLQVVGVDLSEGLIAEAKKRRPELTFQVMNMENLNFPQESFDGIWSKLAILHVERANLPSAISAAYKLLKPNGILYLETKAGTGEGYEPVSFSSNEERYFIYYELEELLTLLKEAGFVDIRGYEYSVGNEHATLKKDRVVVIGQRSK